jgi:excisionase family DNA binding protein
MGGGGGTGLAGRGSPAVVSGPLAEMGRWLEDQGLPAEAVVPLLRYLRGLGAAPWTGALAGALGRSGQGEESLVASAAADVRLLDADDLCRLWKVRKSWLYDAVERGGLPCLRLGNQLRFRPGDVAAYLDRCAREAP